MVLLYKAIYYQETVFISRKYTQYQAHEVRRLCMQSSPPITLIGHSTDSAAFPRSLKKEVMTPREGFISEGTLYLGLDIPDDQYMAPYFS